MLLPTLLMERSAKKGRAEEDDTSNPLSTSLVEWQIGGRSYLSWERHDFAARGQVREKLGENPVPAEFNVGKILEV